MLHDRQNYTPQPHARPLRLLCFALARSAVHAVGDHPKAVCAAWPGRRQSGYIQVRLGCRQRSSVRSGATVLMPMTGADSRNVILIVSCKFAIFW